MGTQSLRARREEGVRLSPGENLNFAHVLIMRNRPRLFGENKDEEEGCIVRSEVVRKYLFGSNKYGMTI